MYDLDEVDKDKEDEAIDALPDFMKPEADDSKDEE
jgi:hypothetical protein